MSLIVSRRPSSRNHWNEAFWMSMRLGSSRTFSIREKDLRARGEATLVVKERASLGDVRNSGDLRRAGVRTDGTSAQPARIPIGPSLPQAKARREPVLPVDGSAGTARRPLAEQKAVPRGGRSKKRRQAR